MNKFAVYFNGKNPQGIWYGNFDDGFIPIHLLSNTDPLCSHYFSKKFLNVGDMGDMSGTRFGFHLMNTGESVPAHAHSLLFTENEVWVIYPSAKFMLINMGDCNESR